MGEETNATSINTTPNTTQETGTTAQVENQPATQTEGNAPGQQTTPPRDEPRFTQADVDRAVAQRLARAQRDAEQRINAARDEGRSEAERLAQMTEAQRIKHERERAENAARERETRLSEREADITRRELRAEAIDTLTSRGLPRELEQLLNYQNADACSASIDAIERVFRAAVQKGVDERINQSRNPLPRSGGDAQAALMERLRKAAGLPGANKK